MFLLKNPAQKSIEFAAPMAMQKHGHFGDHVFKKSVSFSS
jgi:hypothetical protein